MLLSTIAISPAAFAGADIGYNNAQQRQLEGAAQLGKNTGPVVQNAAQDAAEGLKDVTPKVQDVVNLKPDAGTQIQDVAGGTKQNPIEQLRDQVQAVTSNVQNKSPGQPAQEAADKVGQGAEGAKQGAQKAGDEAQKKADEARRKVGV